MIWLPIIGNYTEIDAYASAIAYADLLNQRGKPAKTYILNPPNYSVPEALRIKTSENTAFDFQPTDQAIILDISIPEVIHQYIPNNQILELIDHHPGFEDYWQRELGDRAIIESIGAVATSIFEWWGECWDYHKMSPAIAKLLLAAILDNTLNFNADITTERDRTAANQLAKIASTTITEFAQWYFSTVSTTILAAPENALINDIKLAELPSSSTKFAFGQLTVWDAESLFDQLPAIRDIMGQQNSTWLLSILSITDKCNYFLTNSQALAEYFTQLLALQPQDDFYISSHLILRKEIMRKINASR